MPTTKTTIKKPVFQRINGVLCKDGVPIATRPALSEITLDDNFTTGARSNRNKFKKKVSVNKKRKSEVPSVVGVENAKSSRSDSKSRASKSAAKKPPQHETRASVKKASAVAKKARRKHIVEESDEEEEFTYDENTTIASRSVNGAEEDRSDEEEEGRTNNEEVDSDEEEEDVEDEDAGDEVQDAINSDESREGLENAIDRRLDLRLGEDVNTYINQRFAKSIRDPIVKKVGKTIDDKLVEFKSDIGRAKNVAHAIRDPIVREVRKLIGDDGKQNLERAVCIGETHEEMMGLMVDEIGCVRNDLATFATWMNGAMKFVADGIRMINDGLGNNLDAEAFADVMSSSNASGGSRKDDV